jgi:hypothetical protein
MRPFLLILILVASPGLAVAAPKGCFTTAEITSEREVRHGIYMREATKRCDIRFLKGATERWQKFETANGAKFRASVDRRKKAWQREFPDDWQYKVTHADGSLVTYARNIPYTEGFCDNIDELMTRIDKGGFAGFSKQAKWIQNQVVADYKVCQ